MRSLLYSCALSATLVPPAIAQIPVQQNRVIQNNVVPAAPAVPQQAPQMIAAELRSHDFGTVARSATTEHRFPITNIYQQDMHIRSVRASCGCTTPIVETETIRPGETGSILARFNTGTFTGQRQATLTVSIDRPVYMELQLNVRGYIRSDIVFNPVEANFGAVPEGDSKRIDVSLDYAGRPDWKILDIKSKDSFLQPTFSEVSRGNGRVQYKISIELKDNAPAGLMRKHLLLQTNDNRLTTVPIPVVADIQSMLQVQPQSLVLGAVKPGQMIEQRFVLRSPKSFRILEVEADNAEVVFEPVMEPKQTHLVMVKLSPAAIADNPAGNAILTFKTDLEGDLTVKSYVTYRMTTQGNGASSKPLAGVP
jgi:Protein of unknown function (DUF1573)